MENTPRHTPLAPAVLKTRPAQVVRFGPDLHDAASPGTPLFDLRAAEEMAAGTLRPAHAASHPALAAVAAAAHRLLGLAGLSVQLQDLCALLAPVCAATCCPLIYWLGKEVGDDPAVGLIGAGLFALMPASTSSTASGSFGAQGLALFPLISTVLFYLRAVKGERAWDCVGNACIAAGGLVILSLTWRPYALFLSYLFPFHAAYTFSTGFTSLLPNPHTPPVPQPAALPGPSALRPQPKRSKARSLATHLRSRRLFTVSCVPCAAGVRA